MTEIMIKLSLWKHIFKRKQLSEIFNSKSNKKYLFLVDTGSKVTSLEKRFHLHCKPSKECYIFARIIKREMLNKYLTTHHYFLDSGGGDFSHYRRGKTRVIRGAEKGG